MATVAWNLGVTAGHSILVHGAGTMIGFAAVQMARMRGARVIATAGSTFADRLRAIGATVTPCEKGMVDRMLQIRRFTGLVPDAAPPSGVLPDLVKIAGDPKHVLTLTDSGLRSRSSLLALWMERCRHRSSGISPAQTGIS